MIAVADDDIKQSVNVGRLVGTKPQGSLRRMKASSRWRSEALANSHQALEAYVNLAINCLQ